MKSAHPYTPLPGQKFTGTPTWSEEANRWYPFCREDFATEEEFLRAEAVRGDAEVEAARLADQS